MKISSLIRSFDLENLKDIDVQGIKLSAHNIQNGDLFVSLSSSSPDEIKKNIQKAFQQGASCILLENKNAGIDVEEFPIIKAHNVRKTLSEIASNYYPQSIKDIIGVTGTCGKTSTVFFIRQLLTSLGYNAGTLGTLGVWQGNCEIKEIPKILTTFPTLLLYYVLNFLSKRKVTHFAMEVTSHGLDRHRVDYIPFKVGVFTNFSASHLDYHKTMSSYYAAKRRFFSEILAEGSPAVLNAKEEWSHDMLSLIKKRKMTPILIGKDIRLEKSYINSFNTEVEIRCFGKKEQFIIPFPSTFHIENILFSLGALMGLGIKTDSILSHIPNLQPIEGRMEFIKRLSNGSQIYLDYAHRPHTFEKILQPLKKQGKDIVLVFGCGGGSFKERRKVLGEIAQKYARKIYVTDDNARDEDPAEIRKMILEGCPEAIEIPDRKLAIYMALKSLEPNDICVVAGRGTETIQVIGDKKILLNDKTEILNALNDIYKEK